MIYDEGNKVFLNESHEEFGTVCWNVRVYPYACEHREGRGSDRIPSRNSELRITDCSKSITLDFFYNTDKTYKERLKKLDCLMDELKMFKYNLQKSYELGLEFEENK